MANGFTQKNRHNNSISIHLSSISTLASMEMEMSQIPDDMDDEATGFKLPAIKSLFGNQSEKIESTGRKASVGAMVSATSTNVWFVINPLNFKVTKEIIVIKKYELYFKGKKCREVFFIYS